MNRFRQRGQRGMSLLEVLVASAILAIGAVSFARSFAVQRNASQQMISLTKGQRYEGLLRAQLFHAAQREVGEINTTGECTGLGSFNAVPGSGTRFKLPILTPLRVLRYINFMGRLSPVEEGSDSRTAFATREARTCALRIINAINRSSRDLGGFGVQGSLAEIGCVILTGYTDEKNLEYFSTVSIKYFDFATQQRITCDEWPTARSPGIKVDYSLIWEVGRKNGKTLVTGKSGFLEVQ